jgi:hypothetical protein
MREFLYQNEAIWQEIVESLPEMEETWNIFSFMVFKNNFRKFWNSYRSDYMDTLCHWSMSGAFEN